MLCKDKDLVRFKIKYGDGFSLKISCSDEMYRHQCFHSEDEDTAKIGYLKTGELLLSSLETVLEASGFDLMKAESILEFASGYGRITRFLCQVVDTDRVTVSDISKEAVQFSIKEFDVEGFCSTYKAKELVHNKRYDLIFVCSLFSHLAYECWAEWFDKLYSLLSDKGCIVFSVHGDCLIRDPDSMVFEKPADGFFYRKINETDGRLPTNYYGATFVSFDFVKNILCGNGLSEKFDFYQKGLAGYQDVYVVRK